MNIATRHLIVVLIGRLIKAKPEHCNRELTQETRQKLAQSL